MRILRATQDLYPEVPGGSPHAGQDQRRYAIRVAILCYSLYVGL